MRKTSNLASAALLATAGLLTGCVTGKASESTTLKDAYQNDFLIGVAINEKQFTDGDQRGDPIIKAQFNCISPENALKWASIHPDPGPNGYNFGPADQYVEFGEKNHMTIVGHTLVWHNQTPRWVFRDSNGKPVTREVLLERMRDHIHTVVGRYQGRIKIWDVVNEALNEDGTLRPSPWEKIIGPDYIEKAFQYAHEADPNAILRYNDFSLEKTPKRNGAIALIKKLQAEGIPVTAIGLQDHDQMDWPTVEQEDATISAFAALGLKVMVTELDVNVLGGKQTAEITEMANQGGSNIYTNGLPPVVQQQLAERYADLFRVFVKHHNDISLVTFWGVTDGDSWLNMRGRVNHPLLFDRAGNPKPAFDAVIQAAQPANSK
ncbi:MAG TPA: endo-1,4-beta-xylanase [Verrucomicrobiae bacterium]|nr:endo-1,4-beta-xylanase [Verrucomicrobiae bacterium]